MKPGHRSAFLFTSRIAGRRIRAYTSHGETPFETMPATAGITRAHAATIKTLALLLSAPMEPTTTAPTDAELVPIMAAWPSGFADFAQNRPTRRLSEVGRLTHLFARSGSIRA